MSLPPLRQYTNDQKHKAVLLVQSVGPASAARQLEMAELQMRLETRGPDSCIQRHGCSHIPLPTRSRHSISTMILDEIQV